MKKWINGCKVSILFCGMLFTACQKDFGGASAGLQENLLKSGDSNKMPPGQMLTISKTTDLGMPKVQLYPDTVYSSVDMGEPLFRALPAGFEDQIVSVRLPKGYMAVLAENSDGSGESVCYVAADSAISVNLPDRLRNNISFIRYIPINNPGKKGTAATNENAVLAFGSDWYYGWSLNKPSYPGQQFVPMTWSKWADNDNNVKYLVERTDIDHLLSFNEPDNASQSNIPNIDTAVARYKVMLKTGLRLGAPVTTQGQAFGDGKWLTRFMDKAKQSGVRIDYLPLHWYDWGNQTNNKATDSLTAEGVFNRFKNYIERVHQTYPGYPIWVTEFNANPNRSSVLIHEYFMKLATDWMNATDYIERYSYFFPNSVPGVNADFSLTDAGLYWKNLSSPKAFAGNIVSDDSILIPD